MATDWHKRKQRPGSSCAKKAHLVGILVPVLLVFDVTLLPFFLLRLPTLRHDTPTTMSTLRQDATVQQRSRTRGDHRFAGPTLPLQTERRQNAVARACWLRRVSSQRTLEFCAWRASCARLAACRSRAAWADQPPTSPCAEASSSSASSFAQAVGDPHRDVALLLSALACTTCLRSR